MIFPPIDHIKNFISPSEKGTYFSAAVPSDGSLYGVPKGLIFSFPLISKGSGKYEVVPNIELSQTAKQKLALTIDELKQEREIVKELLS